MEDKTIQRGFREQTPTPDNASGPFFRGAAGDESGAIMVIAMILLAMLALIGFMSINRTTTELDIARNEVQYRRNYLKADAVNVLALGAVDSLTDAELTGFARDWLWNEEHPDLNADGGDPIDYFQDPNNWSINADGTGVNCQEVEGFRTSRGDFDTHYAVVVRRVPGGTTDARGNPLLVNQCEVFSRYASEDGQVIVQSAYRR
jgi:hypothetical protein